MATVADNAFQFMAFWPFTPHTCWLVVATMFQAAGTIAVPCDAVGPRRRLLSPAVDAGAVLNVVEREGVTSTLRVPTMTAALSEDHALELRYDSLLKSDVGRLLKRELRRSHWRSRRRFVGG